MTKAKGEYVDGFSQKEMKDALQRIQNAVNDGLINKETSTKTTQTARNDFKSSDPKTESGVFTYWAGQWADTLRGYLKTAGLDDSIIQYFQSRNLVHTQKDLHHHGVLHLTLLRQVRLKESSSTSSIQC